MAAQTSTLDAAVRDELLRELHDSLAHDAAKILLQVLARGDSDDPTAMRQTLQTIRDVTQHANRELATLEYLVHEPFGPHAVDRRLRVESHRLVTAVAAEWTRRLAGQGIRTDIVIPRTVRSAEITTQNTVKSVIDVMGAHLLAQGDPTSWCRIEMAVDGRRISFDGVVATREFPDQDSLELQRVVARTKIAGGEVQLGPEDCEGTTVWAVRLTMGDLR